MKPNQQDSFIGKQHQHQPCSRVAWIDKLWQSRSKDRTCLRVQQIAQKSLPESDQFTDVCRLRSRICQAGLFARLETDDQASQAKISKICCTGELKDGEGNH